jgi:hypothetical protein
MVLSGILLAAGGSMHPSGSMEQMLASPRWVPGHALVLAGYAALLTALVQLRRRRGVSHRARPWVRFAIVATAAQVVEMVAHTAAVSDLGNLTADVGTPVLTLHLMLAVFCYPLFALGIIGLIYAGARDHVLGSWWIGWLGVIGAVAQGIAAPMVIAGGDTRFAFLFAGVLPLAIWVVLAGLWPVRARSSSSSSSSRAHHPAPVPAEVGR